MPNAQRENRISAELMERLIWKAKQGRSAYMRRCIGDLAAGFSRGGRAAWDFAAALVDGLASSNGNDAWKRGSHRGALQ